jgi:glutamate-ammonia-ligase adenylyltransferase
VSRTRKLNQVGVKGNWSVNTALSYKICDSLPSVGFADWRAAHCRLDRITADPRNRPVPADLLPHLLLALSGTGEPDRVLVNLERFFSSANDRLAMLDYLANNPRAIEILVTLFAGSQFLTEILLRNPEYLALLVEHKRLAQPKSGEQFDAGIQAALASDGGKNSPLDVLRRFHRSELLRIGACDLLGLFDLVAVTRQLSNLADSLVRACLAIAAARSNATAQGFAVIALGKLGGRELNYSSDVDLLFLAASEATAYRRLGERLIEALTRVTAEGFLYRVDMRLRPWGQVGVLVSSLDGHLTYLAKHARPWEKQALLKARVIAGDVGVGETFLQRAGPLIFNNSAVEEARADVHAMKQRTEAQLRRQGRDWGEVKLGEGSIRDVEFVAQYLQLAHGAEQPEVRSNNTLDALARLAAHQLLSADEHRVLADGYVFLRTIEHHLQMMHYRQTHTLPSDAEALTHLARRLGFQGADAPFTYTTWRAKKWKSPPKPMAHLPRPMSKTTSSAWILPMRTSSANRTSSTTPRWRDNSMRSTWCKWTPHPSTTRTGASPSSPTTTPASFR